jgi:hypothetical protein
MIILKYVTACEIKGEEEWGILSIKPVLIGSANHNPITFENILSPKPTLPHLYLSVTTAAPGSTNVSQCTISGALYRVTLDIVLSLRCLWQHLGRSLFPQLNLTACQYICQTCIHFKISDDGWTRTTNLLSSILARQTLDHRRGLSLALKRKGSPECRALIQEW